MYDNKTPIMKLLLLFFILSANFICAQNEKKPKLIIGIVVDQMRAEYLYRFQDNYSENGFKRLMREGFNVKNAHYNYVPTETGPGHASIYTGTTPTNHGIVSNNWYDRKLKSTVYCVEDQDEYIIDASKKKRVSASPKNLLANTFSDELKLFTNRRSKVIGISLKDRGAILPAGHLADYALWYDDTDGNFVTSSYYREDLPEWAVAFNRRHLADSLFQNTWSPLLPIEKYVNSNKDDVPFERVYKGKKNSTFPYDLKKLKKANGGYRLLMETPFGNTLLAELAMTVIEKENLGQNEAMDFLSISFSSTDKVGHDFGIRSKELEDTYVRLDRDLGRLLAFLDSKLGKENYLLFLTADHGSSDNPNFLKSSKIYSGFYDTKSIQHTLNDSLSKQFGDSQYIAHVDNTQIYLNPSETPKTEVLNKTVKFLYQLDGVKKVYVPSLENRSLMNSTKGPFIKNSFNRKRSGDIYVQYYPGQMQNWKYGTTHATSYNDDTHVPLLWYGWKTKKGYSIEFYETTQIVPTLSLMLDIPLPNQSNDRPISEVLDQDETQK